MGTQRASNKDILDAINALTQAITSTYVKPAPVVEQAPDTDVQVPESYLNLMSGKVEAACKADGLDRILYARRNLHGETKLAYCMASRWTGLKDRGLIGAIKHISA